MTVTPSTQALRRAFYGGNLDSAERAFLESAYASGVDASDLIALVGSSGSAPSSLNGAIVVVPSVGPVTTGGGTYQCDGTNDEVQINAAITAAYSQAAHPGGNPVGAQGKPYVLLLPGLYKIKAPISLKDGVRVVGASMAGTEVRADTGFSGAGMIVLNTTATELWEVRDLTLNGDNVGSTVDGIHLDSTGYSSGDVQFADQAGRFTNMLIEYVSQDGVSLTVTRAVHFQNVRIIDAGRDGVKMNGPDGFMNAVDVGGSGRYGFNWNGTNWRVVNCKAWFSADNGWEITGSRNSFVGCEAQDNAKHGFHIGTGDNNLVGCLADCNSYVAGDGNVGLYDGFYIDAAGRVTLAGCAAKEASYGRTVAQRYGFNIAGSTTTGTITGSAKDNLTRGVNIAGTWPRRGLNILVDGTDVLTTQGETALAGRSVAPTGALAETTPRAWSTLNAQTISGWTTGVMYVVAIELLAGTLVTNINFITGSTGVTSPTHWWFALYSAAGALISQTADQTTTSWGANVVKTKALTAAQQVYTTAMYYIGIMITHSGAPTLLGTAPNANAMGAAVTPIIAATDSNTGLTTTAPSNLGTLTATANRAWSWVT